VGIALYPEHATDADGLMQRADTAMYRAKSRGKNQVVVSRAGEDMTPDNGGEVSTVIG